jgi:hypothetical protein
MSAFGGKRTSSSRHRRLFRVRHRRFSSRDWLADSRRRSGCLFPLRQADVAHALIFERAAAKANDSEEGVQIASTLESVTVGTDGEGNPTTAPMVRQADASSAFVADGPKLTKNQQTMLSLLHGAGPSGLTTEQWNEQARAVDIVTKRKTDFYDIRAARKSKGLARQYGDRWNVCQTYGIGVRLRSMTRTRPLLASANIPACLAPGRSRMYCATIATTAMRSSLPLGRLTTICSVPAGSNTGGFPGFQCTTVPLKISVMTFPQSLL